MKISRRKLLGNAALTAGAMSLSACADKVDLVSGVSPKSMMTKAIPSNGERIPVIGLGTLHSFNVDISQTPERVNLNNVLSAFHKAGGSVIDSSSAPLYGKSESVIGELGKELNITDDLFIATKVSTEGRQAGIDEMHTSLERLQVDQVDLMQVHSMRDWENHIPSIRQFQEQGKARMIGITIHRDPGHEQMMQLMRTENLDFIQVNYNLIERNAEAGVFPLAQDKGVAVMVNVPFAKATLFEKTKNVELPAWAEEFDCQSWAQFFLKYTISHPAVTCVIPRTSKPTHLLDNMQAGYGALPDASTRKKMESFIQNLS